MLPKNHRLTSREDFANVYAKGAFAGIYGSMGIKFLPNNLEFSRIGFPVGKNFSKKAVERNRAKRVLRAATYQYLPLLKPGFDIIVMLRPENKELDFKKISAQLEKVFLKANLLNKP